MFARAAILAILAVLLSMTAVGQSTPPPIPLVIPPGAQAGPGFNVDAATRAWLDTFPPADKARSDAYFEGGYWLILWDFLYTVGVMLLLLETGLSARMRTMAERVTGVRFVHSAVYWFEFVLVTSVLSFPLTVYEGFIREHQYHLANQNFGSWFQDQFVAMLVAIVFGGIAIAVLFAVVRRVPRTWPVWGAFVAIVFLIVGALIAPVYIAPLFNKYTLLTDARIRDPILRLARASGIPATNVWEVNASKQSKRVSANVSGFAGTERITLNDNLLNRSSPQEIMAVMGHEMGHYVLNHVYKSILFFAIEAVVLFALLRLALARALAWRGNRWGVRDEMDVAVIPLAALVLAVFGFLLTPIDNTWTRVQEYEADMYGLNAARQPDGFAASAIKLGEYRKLEPGPVEEFIFFDHPSGRTRIHAAMRWKAENLCLGDAVNPCPR